MILTHYFIPINNTNYNNNSNYYTSSIIEHDIKVQRDIAKNLSGFPGRATRRFEDYDRYLYKRQQTEEWLYHAFKAIGGIPTEVHPFYFIIGENEQLKNDFSANAKKIQIDSEQINDCHISFTLGDSMGVFFSKAQKKIYTKQQIKLIIKNADNYIHQMSFLKKYHRYIEAQLWDKQYINQIQIT